MAKADNGNQPPQDLQEAILGDLNWRYATKRFAPDQKLSEVQLGLLRESLRLTPSSFGLQLWRFLFVADPEIRETLRSHAWNQPQVSEASHLVVLCRWRQVTAQDVAEFVADAAQKQGTSRESLAGYEQVIVNFIQSFSSEGLSAWLAKQVYLALGQLLTVCARMRVDACPLEGFDSEAFDDVLGLRQQNLAATVICPIGFRDPSDRFSQLPRVRWDLERVIQDI